VDRTAAVLGEIRPAGLDRMVCLSIAGRKSDAIFGICAVQRDQSRRCAYYKGGIELTSRREELSRLDYHTEVMIGLVVARACER
jgi:hypothetical protein